MAPALKIDRDAWAALWAAFRVDAEAVAFAVGTRPAADAWHVTAFWPTPNLWEQRPGGRSARRGYAIGKPAWAAARARAIGAGLQVLGHVHSHLSGNAVPSDWDVRVVKPGDLGGVWHLGSGLVFLFTTAAGMTRGRILVPLAAFARELSADMAAALEAGRIKALDDVPLGFPRRVELGP